MKSRYFTKRTKLLTILITALFVILALAGCSGNYTKSYTMDIETGDSIKVIMDAAKGYSLSKNEDGFFCIKNKNDGDMHCTMSFYVPDVYGQYSIQLLLEGCNTESNSSLIEGKEIDVHALTYEGDSVAMFWIPDASTGMYIYYENDNDMAKLKGVLEMMKIELLKASSKGSIDPFNDIVQQMQDAGDYEVSDNEHNIYWKVPDGYTESYNCEYFKNYLTDEMAVMAFYEADEADLQVLETGIDIYHNYDSVDIWQNNDLYFVEEKLEEVYKYTCMAKDGSVHLEIARRSFTQIEHSEVENIASSFLNS